MEKNQTKVEIEEISYDFNVYLHNQAFKDSKWSHDGYMTARVMFYINDNIEPDRNGKIELEPAPFDEDFLGSLGDINNYSTIYDYNTLLVARDYLDAVIKKYDEMNIKQLKNQNIKE